MSKIFNKKHKKKKTERTKQLSGYKQCYTYKNQSLEVSKYMNLALITCNIRIGYTAHRQIIGSVLVDMQYHTPFQANLLHCCT